MYAVFEDGSHQFRVSEGDVVNIEYREIAIGATLELTKVLMVAKDGDIQVGLPTLEGARIVTEVVGEDSIKTMKQYFRRRKNSIRLKGHRQHYVKVRIKSILLAGQ